MGETIAEDMERAKKDRTVIADEEGNLRLRGELKAWERYRISLNRWWIFIAALVAASQVAQAVISILNYFRCR